VGVQHRDPLYLAHRCEDRSSAGDDHRGAATLTDALGQERRALEGLSYPDR
jgi:hypothetical protein